MDLAGGFIGAQPHLLRGVRTGCEPQSHLLHPAPRRLRTGCESRHLILSRRPLLAGRISRTRRLYMKRKLNRNLSGNEVYYTASSSLVILNDSCSKLHCRKGFNLILVSYKSLGCRARLVRLASSQFKNHKIPEMCSSSEAGSCLRLIDLCITPP